MEVVIIGKREMKGKSKRTGNDYHFNVIYYTKQKPGVVGVVGVEKNFDPAIMGIEAIYVGELYDLQFDDQGRLVDLRQVTKSK